jgi:RteC protein
MKKKWFTLYESMQKEMENCAFNADFKAAVECCFTVGLKYWSEIQLAVGEYSFDSVRDEIDFYKTVKPLFKSQIEYYNLIYQAQLLKPRNESEIKEFWVKEQQRQDKFIQSHRAFYEYYKSSATHLDEAYFLSMTYTDSQGNPIVHDNLVAFILALERYMIYIQNELDQL